jgi:bacterioferritin (cytochrome b1)
MGRGEDKDPLDVDGVIDGIRTAQPLQLRSAIAFTLGAATLTGFQYVGLSERLRIAGEDDLADARRLTEKLVTLGGEPVQDIPSPELPNAPEALLERLIELERETIEALQDIIPATGQTGESEALEHRLEHMIMRKQETVDALRRARREPA